jgi:hypothetical protein
MNPESPLILWMRLSLKSIKVPPVDCYFCQYILGIGIGIGRWFSPHTPQPPTPPPPTTSHHRKELVPRLFSPDEIKTWLLPHPYK